MANALYDKGRKAFADGGIQLLAHDIRAVLVDTTLYTKDLAADQFLSAITAGARVATSGNFSGKTTTSGVFDADDVTFTAATGAACALLVIYRWSGSAATSELIAAIDTATNLPVTPNSGDIVVAWDNGANKIFKL